MRLQLTQFQLGAKRDGGPNYIGLLSHISVPHKLKVVFQKRTVSYYLGKHRGENQ